MSTSDYTPEQWQAIRELRDQLQVASDHRRFNKLRFFDPYPKQAQFFDLGHSCDERLFFAGNQLGKTEAGGFEAAVHATGLYPDWWLGRRVAHANKGWVGGESSILVRNGPQTKLLGTPGVVEDFGTGYLPKSCIIDVSLARGVTDAYDTVQVRHVDGGVSTLGFKSYEQGREKWQTETLDWVWFDEEPPPDIYSEGLARYTATRGFSFMTFTPLHGMSEVVLKFLDEQEPGTARGHLFMGYDDIPGMDDEYKAKALAKYPVHERDARSKGIPMLGSGKIFTTPWESIAWDVPDYIPPHWKKLWGIDFGIDHPFGAVLMLWDTENDVVYILDAFKMRNANHMEHAARMKPIGAAVPVAWPNDGNSRQKDGMVVRDLYKGQGLEMLGEHATFPNGSVSVEAGILQIQDAMRTGKFKVARHLTEIMQELALYHRKDGKIVKENDDILDAMRYAWMMRRLAKPVPLGGQSRKRRRRMESDWDYDLFKEGP